MTSGFTQLGGLGINQQLSKVSMHAVCTVSLIRKAARNYYIGKRKVSMISANLDLCFGLSAENYLKVIKEGRDNVHAFGQLSHI